MRQIAYTDYFVTIPANSEQVINCTGNYVRCLDSDQADFRLGFEQSADVYFAEGMQVKIAAGDESFTKLRVRNTSGSLPLNIRLGVGSGDLNDDRFLINGSISVISPVPPTFQEQADLSVVTATSTILLATNATRKKAIIQNLEALGGTSIRIGAAPSATQGILLAPQQAIEIETTDEIKGYHTKGSALSVARAEVIS